MVSSLIARRSVRPQTLGDGSVVVDLLFNLTPIVGVCNCSMFVVRYFMSILVLQSS